MLQVGLRQLQTLTFVLARKPPDAIGGRFLLRRSAEASTRSADSHREECETERHKLPQIQPRVTAVRWRRRQFILTGFQTKWLVDQLVFIVVLGAGLTGAVFLPAILQVQEAQSFTAAARFLWLHERFWPVLLAVVGILVLQAIRSSHRVAGPLYRFRLVFDALAEGNLTARLHIRADDYLRDEAAACDRAIQALHSKVSVLQDEVDRLAILAHQETFGTEQGIDAVRQAIARAKCAARALNTNTSDGQLQAAAIPSARPLDMPEAGFSILELLIVVTLVGVLSALAAPTYMGALERARETRAIADIRSMELEIKVFQLTVGKLPSTLAEVRPLPTQDPWGHAYVYTNLQEIKGKGKARKDRSLNPINSDFDLYSVGKDGKSSTPLTAKASHDDIVRANDGGFIGLAADY